MLEWASFERAVYQNTARHLWIKKGAGEQGVGCVGGGWSQNVGSNTLCVLKSMCIYQCAV